MTPQEHGAKSRPYAEIVRGVDPSQDWRAPFVHWTPTELFAAAHAWTGLVDIFAAFLDGEISRNEAHEAWVAHERTRRV